MRKIPLTMQLVLMVAGAILPLAALCGLGLQALADSQAEQNRVSIRGIARAIATAVDGEMRMTIATLQALALTEPLGTADGNVQAVALSAAVRAAHPEWRGLLVSDPQGSVVFSTDGNVAPGNPVNDLVSHLQTVQTGRPAVGPMTQGSKGNLAFPIRVPVMRDGQVRFVLSAIVRTDAIAAVLQRQHVPEGWNVSVFDGNTLRVARAIGDEAWRGLPPSASLRALLEQLGDARELFGFSNTVEGHRVATAITRLNMAPWTLVLGASTAAADGAWGQGLRRYLLGLLASLVLGGLGAWALSRAIVGPMRGLREDADALGSGGALSLRSSNITEIDAVARAVHAAAAQRRAGEAERDRLYADERAARTAAEAAQRRITQLLDAGARLSRSLEEASTLSAIASVIVPEIGDCCRIDLLDAQGRLQNKLCHHVDPTQGAQVAEFASTRSAWADTPGSFLWAIETGQSFVYNVEDPRAPALTDPGMVEFIRILNVRAGCVVPLVARGQTIGAMAVLQTESDRRFSPDDAALINELAQRVALALDNALLLGKARDAQAEAEFANRAKDEFLAMLGHELRNPLAPMAVALQLMARRDPLAFANERSIIARQVAHLSRMVDDLLDVSRIVAGKLVLAKEPVDLRDTVARAMELTQPLFEQRRHPPQIDLPAHPVTVWGDPTRLAQVVGNLLNNAAKFSAPESRVAISLRDADGRAELCVSDEGVGISADLLPHVFERFVQSEQALARAAGGLGLGLPIAQSLAGLHQGTIEARSDGPGRGSSFSLRLPLLAEIPAAAATPATPAHLARRPLRVLLVDDNKDAADLLAEWFESEGHQARVVYSGEEAIAQLLDAPLDAAVFDIGLPGLSGYELARIVRSDPRTREIALIALTGYGRKSDREHAMRAGFDEHFAKPADLDALLETMRTVVWSRGGRPVATH